MEDLAAADRAEGPGDPDPSGPDRPLPRPVGRLEEALLDASIRGEAEEALRSLIEAGGAAPGSDGRRRGLSGGDPRELAVILRLGDEGLVVGAGNEKRVEVAI